MHGADVLADEFFVRIAEPDDILAVYLLLCQIEIFRLPLRRGHQVDEIEVTELLLYDVPVGLQSRPYGVDGVDKASLPGRKDSTGKNERAGKSGYEE